MENDNRAFMSSVDGAVVEMIKQQAQHLESACLIVERDAKINCPTDMSILRASITHDVDITANTLTGRIFSNLDYAPYVHQGTGIYAKDGNGRMTPWKYFAKAGKYKGWHLTHGQKPQPFLEDAKTKNIDKISKTLGGK